MKVLEKLVKYLDIETTEEDSLDKYNDPYKSFNLDDKNDSIVEETAKQEVFDLDDEEQSDSVKEQVKEKDNIQCDKCGKKLQASWKFTESYEKSP